MEIILLERVENLGQMGDVVRVRPGYARNYLIPQQKALRATKENVSFFETRKAELEASNLERKAEAEKVATRMNGVIVPLVRAAAESGQLYGSVSARDIANALGEAGYKTDRNQINMTRAYKTLGLFPVPVSLHPEVTIEVTVNIARSLDEAELQLQRGGALVGGVEEEDEEEEDEAIGAGEPAEPDLAAEVEPAGEASAESNSDERPEVAQEV